MSKFQRCVTPNCEICDAQETLEYLDNAIRRDKEEEEKDNGPLSAEGIREGNRGS